MRFLSIIFLVLFCGNVISQKDSIKTWSIKGYPLVFYTPETKLGFGLASAFSFKTSRDSLVNDSQIQFGGAYTLEKQLLLWIPFKIFWQENKNYLFGEIGYFKYFYKYYGVGNQSLLSNEEDYRVDFPRIRVHYTRKVYDNISLGVGFWFENYKIKDLDGLSLTFNSYGSDGGNTSGFGPIMVYDSRDHVFYPKKGWYVETKMLLFQTWMGSDYEYLKGDIDITHYLKLGKKGVLASNMSWQFTDGNAPFNHLAELGGTKRMRGYYQGRFRNNNAFILQAEYRHELPWRLGLVAFADIGQTCSKIAYLKLNQWHWTAGAGIRFMLDIKRKINIRLDYGIGQNTSGFYFTIGEAF